MYPYSLVRLERGLQRQRHGRFEHQSVGRGANQAVHKFYFFYNRQERQRNVRSSALGMLKLLDSGGIVSAIGELLRFIRIM